MAEFNWVSGGGPLLPCEWRLVADDVTGRPLRFEITCTEEHVLTFTLSKLNGANSFTRSVTIPVGTFIEAIPNAIANKITCLDDTGDALLMVG